MIVCLYGRTAEPFVTPAVADLLDAAAAQHGEIAALPIEAVVGATREWESVQRVYTLPFDVPAALPEALPREPAALVRALFPRAELINAPTVHELTWDKVATAERLVDRGVPMPETLITSDAAEARDFVRRHGQAILKETRACGGHGHVVLYADDSGTIGGEAHGSRFAVDFEPGAASRSLAHGVLSCPPPFYLQRLVTDVARGGALKPGQILRAYVIDTQVVFWAERYRERLRRPGDFIISATFGAKYRFLPEVSDAVQTVARRAVEALGVRVGVVDIIRAGDQGPFVLEADTDGHHMMIDRSFKLLPEYRHVYDFDRYIADMLLAPTPPIPRQRRQRPPQDARPRPPQGVRSGPPRDGRSGPPRDARSGPPRDARSGPPRDARSGPPRDARSGPARGPRSGPPQAARSGPPRGPRSGPSQGARSGPPRGPRSGPPRPRRPPR